tara:strand:+ start:3239 stop:3631 length:393 start_codon:yes stop_codon:yes gene_type:complete
MKQALGALAIADNIALVGSAYTPRSIDAGLLKMRNAATALTERLAHCDRCGKKLGGEGDIHTCTPLIGCVQHDCAECKEDKREASFDKAELWLKRINQAVLAEREACLACYSPDDTATDWADKIRARGTT